MRLFSTRLALPFLGLLVVLCNCWAAEQLEAKSARQGREQQKPKQQPTIQAPKPSNIVAQIGDYVITTEELEQRLMNELRPDDEYSEKVQPVDARTVLMKMIAEQAMVIEAHKQGYLQDEQIQAPMKRFKDRMLINLC